MKASFQLILLTFHGLRILLFLILFMFRVILCECSSNSFAYIFQARKAHVLRSMDHLDGDNQEHSGFDLRGLLSQDPIKSWGAIHEYIQEHPHEVKDRYYRNESPLQLALRSTEYEEQCGYFAAFGDIPLEVVEASSKPDDLTYKKPSVNKIDVLKAITDADSDIIHWRDDEGRTPLHTACYTGCSSEILQWLLDEEEAVMQNSSETDKNATLRTDFPSGALSLHTIAGCSSFQIKQDGAGISESVYSRCIQRFQLCPVQIEITPTILSAYASTATIINANPQAVWDRDCEGELPLHSATSFGNVGSVLALLSAVEEQALILNDRQKSPLSCACERVVAFSVHKKENIGRSAAAARREEQNSLRVSIDREDPFGDDGDGRGIVARRRANANLTSSTNRAGRLNLRESTTSGDQQGYGTSVRSSLSNPFVLSGGRFGMDANQSNNDPLRFSFTSPRQPVHPINGLGALDLDGEEEFCKVELLARAACGFLHDNRNGDEFFLVHQLINLDQTPEVVWHAACKYSHEVTLKDARGCVPLHLACERLARSTVVKNDHEIEKQQSFSSESGHSSDHSFTAGRTFVESFLLGGSSHLFEFHAHVNEESSSSLRDDVRESNEHRMPSSSRRLSIAPRHEKKFAVEIINMLLFSEKFGSKEMASVQNDVGRLPLHIIVDAVHWTGDNDESHPIRSIIDAYPPALEVRDMSTGLFPFMLAASTTIEEGNDLLVVETTFRLLLESPAVISLCLRDLLV